MAQDHQCVEHRQSTVGIGIAHKVIAGEYADIADNGAVFLLLQRIASEPAYGQQLAEEFGMTTCSLPGSGLPVRSPFFVIVFNFRYLFGFSARAQCQLHPAMRKYKPGLRRNLQAVFPDTAPNSMLRRGEAWNSVLYRETPLVSFGANPVYTYALPDEVDTVLVLKIRKDTGN